MKQNIAHIIYRISSNLREETTFRILKTITNNTFKNANELKAYQETKLKLICDWSSKNIPHYTNYKTKQFHDFPIITKDIIEELKDSLVLKNIEKVTSKSTSGTTSQPIKIYKDSLSMSWEQAVTYRSYSWAEILPGDKQARFWSSARGTKNTLKQKIKDFLLNRKTYSSYNFNDENFYTFLIDLNKQQPAYFYGFTSFIYEFACFIESNNIALDLKSLKAIITTAEPINFEQRSIIEKVFKVKVFQEYGCGEVGTIAHEAKDGNLYINAENLFLEIIKDNGTIDTEGTGELLVTEFYNKVQPIIRYKIGDVVTLTRANDDNPIILPIISEINGRIRDMITVDDRKYSPAFFEHMMRTVQANKHYFKQFQVIQNGKQLEIKLVKNVSYVNNIELKIKEILNKEFKNYFNIEMTFVDKIDREVSGKYRLVINKTKN